MCEIYERSSLDCYIEEKLYIYYLHLKYKLIRLEVEVWKKIYEKEGGGGGSVANSQKTMSNLGQWWP